MPWIGDGKPVRDGAEWYADDPAPEFRATFVLPKGALRGRVGEHVKFHVATPGYFRLKVNGEKALPLAQNDCFPLWSPYAKTIYAETVEVEWQKLRAYPLTNEVSVTLGNGWYNMPPLLFWGHIPFREKQAHGRPCFKLTVEGVEAPLAWTWRETDLVQNSIHLGAIVDRTRKEDTVWKPAATVTGPGGRIVERRAPRVAFAPGATLIGRTAWLKAGETLVVDFGENATGCPVFAFPETTRGQKIEIVYGERLNADGSVNALTQTAGQIKRGNGGPGAPKVAAQRDVLVCRGEKVERFEPPFAWHVCRYAEIRGVRKVPTMACLRKLWSQVADAEPGRSFTSPNNDLNRIHAMCRRTFLANLVGVQSDCPGRERLGYGGDIVATCEAYMLNWDMREFYLKTLQDFADEAADDGWITETAPYVGINVRGFGGRSGPISWALAVPVLMDGLLKHYCEYRAYDYYPVCAQYVGLVDAKCPHGLMPTCIGDHEALERVPDEVTATAHWHEFVRLTAKFARALGKRDDAARFEAIAAKIAKAFADKFVKDGVVANGSQSAQALGLYLGLVPADQIATAEARLVKAIEEKDFAPSTGIFTTRYMLMYLSEHGRRDLAEKIVLHRGFPGWLHMLERGATTLWETWKESDDVYSNCHPMFGSVDEWILRFGNGTPASLPVFEKVAERRFVLDGTRDAGKFSYLPGGQYSAEVTSLPAAMRFVAADGSEKLKVELKVGDKRLPSVPFRFSLLLAGRSNPAAFTTKNGETKLHSIVKLPTDFDPRDEKWMREMTVTDEGGLAKVEVALSAGIGQADIRFVTDGRENRPYVEDGRLYFTFSARSFGSYLGVMSIDPKRPADMRLEGEIFFDYGDGKLRNDVAADLFRDTDGTWKAYVANFSTGADAGAGTSGRAPGGVNVAWCEACPLHGLSVMKAKPLGLKGMNEDPDGIWDPTAKKWRLLVSAFTEKGIRAEMLESEKWDGPFRSIAGPIAGDATGTTIVRLNGRLHCLWGSSDRKYRMCSYPGLTDEGELKMVPPPWGDLKGYPHGRGWPAVVEVPGTHDLLMVTMDRINFPGMPKPNWTYGKLMIYHAP